MLLGLFSALNFKSEYAPFALWDADFDTPVPQSKAIGMFDCRAVLRLPVKWPIKKAAGRNRPNQNRVNNVCAWLRSFEFLRNGNKTVDSGLSVSSRSGIIS